MSQNTLSTRVIKLKSFFESLAEIMGFLAGFSFISRFLKYILVSHGVGATYDKMIAKHHDKVQKIKQQMHDVIKKNIIPQAQSSPVKQYDDQRPYTARNPIVEADNFRFKINKSDEIILEGN